MLLSHYELILVLVIPNVNKIFYYTFDAIDETVALRGKIIIHKLKLKMILRTNVLHLYSIYENHAFVQFHITL